jgi:hypothetical protein
LLCPSIQYQSSHIYWTSLIHLGIHSYKSSFFTFDCIRLSSVCSHTHETFFTFVHISVYFHINFLALLLNWLCIFTTGPTNLQKSYWWNLEEEQIQHKWSAGKIYNAPKIEGQDVHPIVSAYLYAHCEACP